MKKLYAVLVAMLLATGCAAPRMNISYDASKGDVAALSKPVKGAVVSVVDAREETKIYPKQVIQHTTYGGEISYDINDRTVDEVFRDALARELDRLGVDLYKLKDVEGPLDRESAARVAKELSAKYPDIQVAFGAKVTDFMARSQRTLVTTKVNVNAVLQFYVLDVKTGDVLWAEYKSESNDTAASADHNYMIEKLDVVLESVIHKAVRDNMSLRDFIVKASSK